MNADLRTPARRRFELDQIRASGTRYVALRAPDGSPPECLADDEEVYPIERALREAPLPHSAECTCFYAPRWWLDEAASHEAPAAHEASATP